MVTLPTVPAAPIAAEIRATQVAVVLVNWNGWSDSAKAHRSLLDSDFKDWVLIVVDNASTDDSLTHLRKLDGRIHLIESTTNLGFAGGCNLAAVEAQKLGVDHVFFLNNDAVVTPSTLSALVSASYSLGDRAVLGSVVRYLDGGELQFFGSRQSSRLGTPEWFVASEEDFVARDALIPSDFIFGASLFVPMSVFRAVGAFDERFFLNFEETDWCYRARMLGFDCIVIKAALTYHKGSASLGPGTGPLQEYFMLRNRLLFCEKHATRAQLARSYFRAVRDTQDLLRRALGLKRGVSPGFDPRSKALLLALRDYVFRRFRDCPPVVRELARTHRDLDATEHNLQLLKKT